MNQAEERTYRSGDEVLEYYVPGYISTSAINDDDVRDVQNTPLGEQMMEKLLAGLKSKLDKLLITKPGG